MNPGAAVLLPGTTQKCFGPFNTNVPLPYGSVTLNHGQGYNPSLGNKHRLEVRTPALRFG